MGTRAPPSSLFDMTGFLCLQIECHLYFHYSVRETATIYPVQDFLSKDPLWPLRRSSIVSREGESVSELLLETGLITSKVSIMFILYCAVF
jgi:hypothetical protein